MDKLAAFFQSLSPVEKHSFRNYLKLKSNGRDNKRMVLYDLMLKNKSAQQIKTIFTRKFETSENAFYQLKRAIVIELEKFIMQNRSSVDHKSGVYASLELAQHFMDCLRYDLAWSYLKEAERIAEVNGFFEILPAVYLHQMQVSNKAPMYRQYARSIISRKDTVNRWLTDVSDWLGENYSEPDQNNGRLESPSNNAYLTQDRAVFYRKLEWWTGMRHKTAPMVNDYFPGQITDEVSLHNRLHWYLLELNYSWHRGEIDRCESILTSVKALFKMSEQLPLGMKLESCRIELEMLMHQQKFSAAFRFAEKLYGIYAPQVPDDQLIQFTLIMISVSYRSGRAADALEYFRKLEAKKESVQQMLGQHHYNRLMLLKAALHAELLHEETFLKIIGNIGKSTSLSFFRKAFELLYTWNEYREQPVPDPNAMKSAFEKFLSEFPADFSDCRNPDFAQWAHLRCAELITVPGKVDV